MAVKGKAKYVSTEPQREEKVAAGSKALSPATTPEFAMDAYLAKLNLYRKPIAKDGSCLFRVVSEQVYNTQARHFQVRQECIEYMHKNKELLEAFIEGSYEHHLYNLRNPKEWGGQVEIYALSHLYKRDFIVYQPGIPSSQQVTCNGYADKINLCYLHGNHYDAVYPLTFQSNAAMVQSILYDVLLDDVFPEISRRELNEESKHDSSGNSGWTEVKTKKNGGKYPDETSDRITCAIPEAAKNPKVMWQIKRSLDTNNYRNIELEVWENFKTDLQPFDTMVKSPVQLKPGDLCLATIKESKDVSDTIRVKIHEIKPDKCVVFSENLKNKFYVPLNDLQPLVNGFGNSSHKNLPGYYNKLDFDSEFQSQRRRGRGNRKPRDGDERHRKSEFNGSTRNPESNKHELKYDKEPRNNRRPLRKEDNKRKDADNKDIKSCVSKVKPEAKRIDAIDQTDNKSDNLDSETQTTVAQPAETSAAFWGRMRMKPNGTSYDKICESVPSSKHTFDNSNCDVDNKIKKNDHHSNDGDKKGNLHLVISSPSPLSSDAKSLDSKCELNKPGCVTANHGPAMNTLLETNNSLTNGISATNCSSLNGNSMSSSSDFKPIVNSNTVETQKLSALSSQASARVNEVRENIKASTTKLAGKVYVNTKLRNGNIVSCNGVGISEPGRTVNYDGCLSDDTVNNSDSSSYNEGVNELSSIPLQNSCHEETAVGLHSNNHTDHSTGYHSNEGIYEENGYSSENNDDSELGDDDYEEDQYGNDFDNNPNNNGTGNDDGKEDDNDEGNDDNVEKEDSEDYDDDNYEDEEEDEEEEGVVETDVSHDLVSKANINEDGNGPANEITGVFEKLVLNEQKLSGSPVLESTDSLCVNNAHGEPAYPVQMCPDIVYYSDLKVSGEAAAVFIENSTDEKRNSPLEHCKYSKDKSKKKVSFGCTTEIVEKPQRPITQSNIEATPQINSTEPGKIILPPEHIEKHINEFPILHIPEVVQQPQVIHPAYVHGGMSFYPHPHVSPVLPMYSSAPANEQSPITLSRDPEGKDLPEDINILRYFFNLGVQWHYANHQTNMQLNQPGILPLPVHAQQMSSLSVRPLMMNADAPVRNVDYYTQNSQSADNSQMELRQQQQQALLLPTRLQHTPPTNLTLPHFHGAPYEEYELPPRLRRGPAKGNRYTPQRQSLNGRGIMGHGPRVRCDNNRTSHQMLNYSTL